MDSSRPEILTSRSRRSLVAASPVAPLLSRYRYLLERLAELAAKEKLSLVPYRSAEKLCFQGLSVAEQSSVLWALERYIGVAEAAIAKDLSLLDDRQMLWLMVKDLALRPPSDLFQSFEDDDILEIYLVPQFVQVYRSFFFFYLCSYSLDDLLCRPWWELYRRDESVTVQVMDKIKVASSPANPRLTHYDVGAHVMEETESPGLYHSVQELRFVAPLFDEYGGVGGIVNVVRPQTVTAKSGPDGEIDILRRARMR